MFTKIFSKFIKVFILLFLLEYNLFASYFLSTEKEINELDLKKELDLLFKNQKDIFWGVSIADLNSKEIIYAYNQDKVFRPASNMKLIISAATLKALSKDFKYNTKFYVDGPIIKQTLYGNLIIKGSGDPTFTTNNLKLIIEAISKYNFNKITGNIIGFDTVFDDEHIGVLWSWNNLSNCYSAQISGLQINNNCINLFVEPGTIEGYTAKITKNPNTSYLTIFNKTTTSKNPTSLDFERKHNSNDIYISGNININSKGENKWVSVNNPSNYFLNLVYEYLLQNNIEIHGGPINAKESGYIFNKDKTIEILNIKSKDLISINNDLLKYSINLYGETLLKTLGSIYFNHGSIHNGRLAINLIFKEYELNNEELFIADGSGLSNLNLISPDYLINLLVKVYKSPFFNDFYNSLSVSGMSGTLRNKFNSSYLKGSIHAKTGYINNVRTLSGYINTISNKKLAFVFFANNYSKNISIAENKMEKACKLLRKF